MKELKGRIHKELTEGVLKFWLENSVDDINGGFYGEISNNNIIYTEADKGLILNSRILWSFSRSYNLLKDSNYLKLAKRAMDYLIDYFWDNNNGGFIWLLNYKGEPKDKRKQIYGQAFAIYALSEYFIASNDIKAKTYAIQTYELIEKFAYDKINSGYFEALSETWESTDDCKLSVVDMNEKKSNNTHLHIMEAYSTLNKIWDNCNLKIQLKQIVSDLLTKIMDQETMNFRLFFDEYWNVKSDIISYGHEIEASWLIYEALKSLGDEEFKISNMKYVLGIAENCLLNYLDGDLGKMGMFNEDDGHGNVDKDKVWWVQAEACVGFYLAYQLTGKESYLQAVRNIWKFIEDYVVDKNNGEWFWYASDSGTKSKEENKVSNWKSFYHNSRACIELLERIK